MKSRRTKIALLLTIVVLAVGGFLRWARYEPSYRGKSLSGWVATYSANANRDLNMEVDAAIREMGVDALPHLLKILHRKDSDPFQQLAGFIQKQTIIKTHYLPAATWRTHAAAGVRALGEEGEPALPVLTRLLEDPETAPNALDAAAKLGWKSLPLIQCGLAKTNDTIRRVAAVRLEDLAHRADARNHAGDLVPLLLKNLKDSVPMIRRFAASGLVQIGDRETAIAALLSNIQDPDRMVRFTAAWKFQAFGYTADSAIPKLKELRKDPVFGRDAERALSFIRLESEDVYKSYFRSGVVVPPPNPYK